MERELSWFELGRVIEEHEAHHNHHELKDFCDRYYPRASRVVVQAVQEYNDNDYYFTFGPSNISVWDGEWALCVPADDVALLVLLAESADLDAVLREDKPDDPLGWLEERYGEDVYNLELCGIEKGYDIEVDLALSPPQPTRVYVKEMANALPADD